MQHKMWEALAFLRQHKLIKHSLSDDKGGYCAWGVLLATETRNDLAPETMREARVLDGVMREMFPERVPSYMSNFAIAQVNNHPDTTQADVEMAMEKAAIKMDEMVP